MRASDKSEYLSLLDQKITYLCEQSYYVFFQQAWKIIEPTTNLVLTPHIKYLCDIAQKNIIDLIYNGRINYETIIINIPPGESKSSIFTKILNAWIWIHDPSFRIITNSYNNDLALDQAMKTRDIIQSNWYKDRWGHIVQLKQDMKSKSRYGTTETGIRQATSTGGAATGFHCQLWIDDDPLNVKQSYSELHRKEALLHSNQTVPSRIKNGFRILVMQRLHDEDPTGDMLRKLEKRILHIKLPASTDGEIKPENAVSLYHDGLLDPIHLNRKTLAEKKEDLGAVMFNQQYMQEATPVGGNIVLEKWFQIINEKELPGNITWDMWVDGAYTNSTANDPTGIMIAGYSRTTKAMYVKFTKDAFMEMPQLLKVIPEIADLHDISHKSRVFIEPKASGKSLRQMINNETNLSAVEIKSHLVSEGKMARIQTAAPKVEAGKVILVKGSWNDPFVAQITGFPNAKHDEYVDLIGYATQHYFKKKSGGIKRRN